MSVLDPNSFDHVTAVPPARRRKSETLEYRVYFALIFGASLPIALMRTLFPSMRKRAFGMAPKRRGVIGEARMMANIITPLIFSV
ncbi:MAG: cytochrome PufQ [Rubricella sp.]